MSEEDVYEELRLRLDASPVGCPPAPEFDEILRILFSEDEALLACGLAFMSRTAEDAARRAGLPPEGAEEVLERLADRGVIGARKKDGVTMYSLLPVMPGIFELPFMSGEKTELTERLAPLWRSYMELVVRELGSPEMSVSRIIPVQEEVENAPGVLTYEMLYDLIDKADKVGVAHCACRESEERCDAEREACMVFDDKCDFLVERGFRALHHEGRDERDAHELDAAGLVHQVNNSQDKLSLICNCCPCCCHLLRGLTEWDKPERSYRQRLHARGRRGALRRLRDLRRRTVPDGGDDHSGWPGHAGAGQVHRMRPLRHRLPGRCLEASPSRGRARAAGNGPGHGPEVAHGQGQAGTISSS